MLKPLLRHTLRGLIAVPVVLIAIVAGILIFTAPRTPPPIAAIEVAGDPFAKFAREQPQAQFLTARDGGKLAYRYYPGQVGKGVAVLVHGSSGTAVAMHGMAEALSAQGISVYAPDLRGHGLSAGPGGRLGDVVYRGQYEDDLADLSAFVAKAHPGEKRLLVGHSMGGAVILRTASQADRAGAFDGYLALSPFIAPDTEMDRPSQGGWTIVSVPRIVVLSILNGFGIDSFDHLIVLAMAVPPEDNNRRPKAYSHALLASANLPRDWEPAIGAIEAPTQILIGSDDELFRAEAYPGAIGKVNPGIPVTLMPEVTHMGIVYQTEALTAITTTAQTMLK